MLRTCLRIDEVRFERRRVSSGEEVEKKESGGWGYYMRFKGGREIERTRRRRKKERRVE